VPQQCLKVHPKLVGSKNAVVRQIPPSKELQVEIVAELAVSHDLKAATSMYAVVLAQ